MRSSLRRLARWLAPVYIDRIRPVLEDGAPVRYAGVVMPYVRKRIESLIPDRWLPAVAVDIPEYEEATVRALRLHVEAGDRVVVVGGGVGVTAVVAALEAGPSGSVEVFEAIGSRVLEVDATVGLNHVADRVRVHLASVARPVQGGGPVLETAALPTCDVLELDCEGAEVAILEELEQRPRVVIVETHGVFGAPTSRTVALLEDMGYRVEDVGVAEPRFGRLHFDQDVHVVVARRV